MKFKKLFIVNAALIALLALQSSFALNIANTDHIYYFGDSLSDTGYMNNSQNYVPTGQTPVYTTPLGHTAVYYLGEPFNHPTLTNNINPPVNNQWVIGDLGGDNYAAGGATTNGIGLGKTPLYSPPSLQQQVSHFLSTHQPAQHPNNLYIIWIGANDIFRAFKSTPSSKPLQLNSAINKAIDKATTTIQEEVTILHKSGAQHIIVLNLPPMGDTPRMSKSIISKIFGNKISTTFNTQLSQKLASLKTSTGYAPSIFNVNSLFKTIFSKINTSVLHKYQEPNTALILTNDKDPACLDVKNNPAIMAINCSHWVPTDQQANYVFADNVHPSDTTHQILALHLESYIKKLKS
jgi:phospholipase/lecithinase/hemolysin